MNGQVVLPWSPFARGITLILCCACLAGCSFYPLRYDVIESQSLEHWDESEFLSPQELISLMREWSRNKSERPSPNTYGFTLSSSQTARISCKSSSDSYWLRTWAKLNGGASYPLRFDTGSGFPFLVTDAHIRRSNLPFRPIRNATGEWEKKGVCRIDHLSMGEMTLNNVITAYKEKDWGYTVFGMPVLRANEIILGLYFLRQFRFVCFDGIQREVEFSPRESFVAEREGDYEVWPISMVPKEWPRLIVTIPVAGEEMRLMFDTGASPGIIMTEGEWNHLSQRIQPVQLKRTRDFYPFCGGWISCQEGRAEELVIGTRNIGNLKIKILPDEIISMITDCQGLLGMQPFNDTVMVLDFEHMQMWVKKTPGEAVVSKD